MKLNNKGFTLVELLAVIVILGLLIIIVMNTALPAMNEAKTRALKTYAGRLVQKAQEKCAEESLVGGTTYCGKKLTHTQIMGTTGTEYLAQLSVTYSTTTGAYNVTGCVQTKDKKLTVKVENSKVTDGACPAEYVPAV